VPRDPRITICIPAYQASRFVATAIESAIRQTVPADEIVVSDNWSTDGTAAILERYKGQIEITRPWTHLSMSDHYWYLTECASGDYVVWLDADNALHPRFVETVAPLMGRHAMIATGRFDCDSGLRPTGYSGLGYVGHRNCGPGDLFPEFLQGCRHSHSGTAWDRNWILALPRPPKDAEYVTDWYLGVVTAAYRSIAMLPAPRHYYRYHEGNASHSEPERWKRSAMAMLEWLASLDLFDAARRAAVGRRAALLAADSGHERRRPSLLARGKQLVRIAVSSLARYTHRPPAYLR
jgi:glycosyltransferase involved in cell wall biosynthesis